LIGAKILGVKVLWRGEGIERRSNQKIKTFAKKLLLRAFFSLCDGVMYSCSGNKSYLKTFGISEPKLFSIPCAVDNEFFQNEFVRLTPLRQHYRESLGIQREDFVVVFCARFTSRKNPRELLQALEIVKSPRVVALFVGDGPEKPFLVQYAHDKNIRAIFTGFKNQSEIGVFYRCADLAINISSYDPSPKAMNEAMNFSLPLVVSTGVGTAFDLVTERKNGFIIEVGDVNGLARAILYLEQNRDVAVKMGEQSKSIVDQWSYEKDINGILKAIEAVS
jgi:glycosyltransferase involved in cell wall biosynthesis